MSQINKLSAVDEVTGSDLLAIWQSANSDTRKASINQLLTFMQANITFPAAGKAEYTKQYNAPNATGFNVQVTDTGDNTWLILTPDAGYAAGTITLPALANLADDQEILIFTTQQVTTLTIALNGASAIKGEPNALGADDHLKLKYDALNKIWYRIG